MENTKVIFRHGIPSKLDTAPFGTICKINGFDKPEELYIQKSQDQENPIWEQIWELPENNTDS